MNTSKNVRWWIIIVSVALLALALAVAVLSLTLNRPTIGGVASTPVPTFAPISLTLIPPASLQALATRYPQLANILADPELDSVYKDFLITYQQSGLDAATALARQRGLLSPQNEVRATLILDTPENEELVRQLEASGVIVEDAYKTQVDIAVPMELIRQAADSGDPGAVFARLTALEHVIRVKLPSKTQPGPTIHRRDDEATGDLSPLASPLEWAWRYQSGDPSPSGAVLAPPFVTGQGVHVIHADAWHKAGLTGKGVKVGILDCGFKGYKALLGNELPASVQAKTFVRGLTDPNDSSEEHGTAVAEIVHEVAPDAVLYLADYGCRGAAQGRAVEWLLAQGVKIISHSAGNPAAPMDGSGWQAQFVQEATSQGVLWVNSAGNEAETHYRGVFTDANKNGFHEWKLDQESMAFRLAESHVDVVLRWDDWGKADQDLDLVLLDADGKELAWSRNAQNGAAGDEPLERIEYDGLLLGETYRLAVYASHITRTVTMDVIVSDGGESIEFPVPDHSLLSPADARDALAVGAAFWQNDRIADYSSRGPTMDGRLKPDLSAPTFVDSATYGRFGGTSAAAPHVAGAAALVWGAAPSWNRQQVWEYLTRSAVDLGPRGWDNAYGAGRLQLPDPPTPQPETVTPGQPTPSPVPPTAVSTRSPVPAVTILPSAMPLPVAASPLPTIAPKPVMTATSTAAATATATASPAPGAWRLPSVPMGWVLGGCGGLALLMACTVILLRAIRCPRQPPLPHGPAPRVPPPLVQPAAPQAMPRCPHCGRPVRTSARFCAGCGRPLLPQSPAPGIVPQGGRCRQCGQVLRTGAQFCARCGTRQ